MLPEDNQLQNRALTKIGRAEPSRPLECILSDGVLEQGTHLFDSGYGRGDDLRRPTVLGHDASGCAPVQQAGGRAP